MVLPVGTRFRHNFLDAVRRVLELALRATNPLQFPGRIEGAEEDFVRGGIPAMFFGAPVLLR